MCVCVCVCVCVCRGTFERHFFYFLLFQTPRSIFIFKCTNLKVVYRITLIVLVIGKAQFRRAMLSCDSSCFLFFKEIFLCYFDAACDLVHIVETIYGLYSLLIASRNEPRHEKTNILHMRKQRRRSASR